MIPFYLCGIYTVTPTHCGTGQASAAVDLPIARESHTGFPELPASSLKGAWRARLRNHQNEQKLDEATRKTLRQIFGPTTDEANTPLATQEDRNLSVGQVNFFTGQLLAFPVRALHECFVYATCPLLLQRFRRMLQTFDSGSQWPDSAQPLLKRDSTRNAIMSRPLPADHEALVLEDLILEVDTTGQHNAAKTIATLWSQLLPQEDTFLQSNFIDNLVVIDNSSFQDLVRRTTPVQARVKLNENKTTGSSSDASGNLWYEEVLPADCLFYQPLVPRDAESRALKQFVEIARAQSGPFQVGGNETVGQGVCAVQLCLGQDLQKGSG